jgi:hypothetical protein
VIDREWLTWIGRFRFVTGELLALRFGVSERAARTRTGRLEVAGLVVRQRRWISDPFAIAITNAGLEALGRPPRRQLPRTELQREHELAVVRLVADLELAGGPGAIVLTERDCRRRAVEGQRSYCVAVSDDRGRRAQRWPDVVVPTIQGGVAFEIELAPKHSARLARMLRGYLISDLAEVRFLLASVALARRLSTAAGAERLDLLDGGRTPDRLTRIIVEPWAGASAADRAAIAGLAA